VVPTNNKKGRKLKIAKDNQSKSNAQDMEQGENFPSQDKRVVLLSILVILSCL